MTAGTFTNCAKRCGPSRSITNVRTQQTKSLRIKLQWLQKKFLTVPCSLPPNSRQAVRSVVRCTDSSLIHSNANGANICSVHFWLQQLWVVAAVITLGQRLNLNRAHNHDERRRGKHTCKKGLTRMNQAEQEVRNIMSTLESSRMPNIRVYQSNSVELLNLYVTRGACPKIHCYMGLTELMSFPRGRHWVGC